MTTRAETIAPLSRESRRHLLEHRDELLTLASVIDRCRDDLRTDRDRGVPIDPDVIRVVQESADLLEIASYHLDPDHGSARR